MKYRYQTKFRPRISFCFCFSLKKIFVKNRKHWTWWDNCTCMSVRVSVSVLLWFFLSLFIHKTYKYKCWNYQDDRFLFYVVRFFFFAVCYASFCIVNNCFLQSVYLALDDKLEFSICVCGQTDCFFFAVMFQTSEKTVEKPPLNEDFWFY